MDHENVRDVEKSNETTRISHSSISSHLPTRMRILFPHKRSLSPVIYFYLVRGKLTLSSFIPLRFIYVSARHPVARCLLSIVDIPDVANTFPSSERLDVSWRRLVPFQSTLELQIFLLFIARGTISITNDTLVGITGTVIDALCRFLLFKNSL